jgi:hypothetical protein
MLLSHFPPDEAIRMAETDHTDPVAVDSNLLEGIGLVAAKSAAAVR